MTNQLCYFNFINYDFKLPKDVIFYNYKWLGNLFNIYNFGEEKYNLDTNLIDFIANQTQHNNRIIVNILKKIESFHINNDESIYDLNKYHLEIIENFLNYGPGDIMGIDIEFKCINCDYKTYNIPKFYNINKNNNNNKNIHLFKDLTSTTKICNRCGLFIDCLHINNEDNFKKYKCIDICIDHIFEYNN